MTSLSQLDRRRHIEPFITSLTTAVNSVTGEPITVADRIRRVHAVGNFLAEITEWGWDDTPPRRLIFRADLPRPQRFLPRYLPVDEHRTRQTDARTLTGLATEVAHLRTAVEALAEGVKRHEEQLRRITKPPPRR